MTDIATVAAAALTETRIYQPPEGVARDLYRLVPRPNSLAHLLGCECHEIKAALLGIADHRRRVRTDCPVHRPHLRITEAALVERMKARLQ